MSNPEPRHHGDKGEVNAVFRPASTPADVRSPSGGETHFVASEERTVFFIKHDTNWVD
ncbi:hypothetical protein OG292_12345 [Streptomyces sp. NBC_01511]|uniref:hypothetical protein n=1 Tax=Streptomyces sp. NBC_01511 TaxID=2903889 RepID=UPI00386C959A